jgi:hypothetical protein
MTEAFLGNGGAGKRGPATDTERQLEQVGGIPKKGREGEGKKHSSLLVLPPRWVSAFLSRI